MASDFTKIKEIYVEKFRGLEGVRIKFADCITTISGKNGTSKSTILGIVAQIFSFSKNYQSGERIYHRDILGRSFKSLFSDHFRFSKEFDKSGSMKVKVKVYDGYTSSNGTAELTLTSRNGIARAVVRKNSTVIGGQTSRNFTHPVIFLSLKRLYPISDREYNIAERGYFKQELKQFLDLNRVILNRSYDNATATDGNIKSASAHNKNYDHESVSAGEDNIGQIIIALMSFEKLKREYIDYKGGILLIDEVDAGLFPLAQKELYGIFQKKCKELGIQVIVTTHSPVLIETSYMASKNDKIKYKNIYITDSYGDRLQIKENWSWDEMRADLFAETLMHRNKSKRKIRVYFEDQEARDLFRAIMSYNKIEGGMDIMRNIDIMDDINLGAGNYFNLIKHKIPEFSEENIICLDPDQCLKDHNTKTVIKLPGGLPPDQLLFEYLYNLPGEDDFWSDNKIMYTKAVFTKDAERIRSELQIRSGTINLKSLLSSHERGRIRELFKEFYKNTSRKWGTDESFNVFRNWVVGNGEAVSQFQKKFEETLKHVMVKAHNMDHMSDLT